MFSLEKLNKKGGIIVFDYSKLKGRMKEKEISQEDLAARIGKNKSTISLKFNNQGQFTQEEIVNISETLEIPVQQISEYFFTKKV